MKINLKPSRSGFSLVEMLVVIAILGVLSSIVVPLISSLTGQSKEAKLRSNARHVAQMSTMAVTAGSPALLAATSSEEAVALLQSGVYGAGDFSGVRFQVTIGAEAVAETSARLNFDSGILSYDGP